MPRLAGLLLCLCALLSACATTPQLPEQSGPSRIFIGVRTLTQSPDALKIQAIQHLLATGAESGLAVTETQGTVIFDRPIRPLEAYALDANPRCTMRLQSVFVTQDAGVLILSTVGPACGMQFAPMPHGAVVTRAHAFMSKWLERFERQYPALR